VGVRLSLIKSEGNMKKTNLEQIKEMVNRAKNLPNVIIEYNMELPPEVSPDNFFGIPARENKNIHVEKKLNLIYKY